MRRTLSLAPSRRLTLVAAALATAGVLTAAGVGVVRAHDEVLLEVDGVFMPVTTWNGTTRAVLADRGIEVGPHDLVQPALDAQLVDGDTVVVRTAHPYTVTVDGSAQTLWSTAESAERILADASVHGQKVVLAADRSASRGLIPLVDAARPVPVVLAGKTTKVMASPGQDVRSVLTRAGIKLSPIDRVNVDVTDGKMTIGVTRVVRGAVAEDKTKAFSTREEPTDTLFVGEKQVKTEGRDGTIRSTVWRESIDGKETHRVVLAETTTAEPNDRVISTGTREVTPKALVEAGLDPKATLEEKTEDDGTVSVRYRAALGTISSPEEIAQITGDVAAATSASRTSGIPLTYSGEDPRSIARGMVHARGWSDSEFQCLVALWERESNWNPYAENPSSGAYGIPQSLPGSKMASAGDDWRTNPATQITWGLGYIAGRYGTPCGALGHSDAYNWY